MLHPILNAFPVGSHDHVAGLQLRRFGGGSWLHVGDLDLPLVGEAGRVGPDEQHQGDHDVQHSACGQHRYAPALGLCRQAVRIGGILLAGQFYKAPHRQPIQAV